ncbi:MAG: glycosyltransferase family 4 protein [Rhodospirillales bacterium]
MKNIRAKTSLSLDTDQNNSFRHPTVMQVLPELLTGGVERGAIDVAGAIVESGGRALVVSAGGPMTYELKRLGAEHFELPVASKNPFIMWKNIKRLANLALDQKVDIIHARSRAPAWSAWYAARQTNKHFVTTFHGTYSHNNWFKRWYNNIMTKGERVIAISDFISAHIRKTYGVPVANIRVIPRGIDINKFDTNKVSQERRIKLANEWRLPDDMPIIILPGRITRWKGQTVFIDAIKKLGRKDIMCLIVGSDQGRKRYRRELEERIANNDLQDIIHLVDHCKDMAAAYMLTDIVVSASTEPEAFGRVIVEAQSLGRPVIGTNHGGTKETIVEGKTGLLVEPNDPDSLAKAITEILNLTEEQREKFSQTAISHSRKNYSKELMCSRTLDIYDELIAGDAIASA